jgi:hypothetical protein
MVRTWNWGAKTTEPLPQTTTIWGIKMRKVLGLALLALCGSAQAATIIYDGPDFVNDAGIGTDEIPDTRATFTIELLPIFGGAVFAVTLDGPMTVERSNHVNGGLYNGSVDTEITDMVLTGGGMTLRAGVDQGVAATYGGIQQTGDSIADSWFNIFFEIDGTPFGTLHNNDPYVLEAEIDQIYPAEETIYMPPDSAPIALYDGGNTLVGHATASSHAITPIPAAVWLFGSALGGLGWMRRRSLKAA